jgi:ABC-type lipoprotein export system ATPase subunit
VSLKASDLCHRYRGDDCLVLDGAHLALEAGESVALVGPSGSGKTTLLAICGGLLAPTSGTVELDGVPMSHRLVRTKVSWVFQGANALLARSVIDNVVLRALAQGRRRRDAMAEGWERLVAVGLADIGDRPAATLSGGELQRACVARALMGDPTLVCADEPSGQLDAAATAQVIQALTDAGERRAMLLIATHDRAVAAACDRVLELADGQLGAPR